MQLPLPFPIATKVQQVLLPEILDPSWGLRRQVSLLPQTDKCCYYYIYEPKK